MPKTTPLVAFGLFAQSVKQDATFNALDDIQSFSKPSDLKTGNVSTKPIITYEPNFWVLDGQYKFKADNDAYVHIGLMSLEMSNGSGTGFGGPPNIDITFTTVHSTDGLTLRFLEHSGDWASTVTIWYYDAFGSIITSDTYHPTSAEFSTTLAVSNFKRVYIEFSATNKPYRYARLLGVDFGQLTYFTASDIKKASVVEEVDPLSITLPIDTFEMRLFSQTAEFSIINPSGSYAALQQNQPFDVYEDTGDKVYIGQFFLRDWENPSDKEVIFRCVDRLGVLDRLPYVGVIYDSASGGILVENLIDGILTPLGVPYELDLALYGTIIKGWIPYTTVRAALQQIAFAIGAYVTCSRSGIIRIIKTVLASDAVSFDFTVTKSQKSLDEQSLTLKPLVTGVQVTAHSYLSNANAVTLYNGSLGTGTYTIKFTAPAHNLSISGATITSSGANYAIINVASPGTVLLTGQGYDDTTQVFAVNTGGLDPNVVLNVLSISTATLVTPATAQATTQRVYDYYQMRYTQKVKLYAPEVEPGRSVLIDTLYGQQIGAVLEKLTLDLTGGMIGRAEMTGVVQ